MKENIVKVEDFFALYKTFAWEKDSEGMINLYDENVVIFDMWDKAHISGLEEWSGIIREWLGSLNDERVDVVFDMVEIHEGEGNSFASAKIMYQAISPDNKVLRSMWNRITLGFTKKGSTWKVLHQHTSAPIGPNLQAILTK